MMIDLSFLLLLALKMAVTAAFVVTATFLAQRSGPLLGALVATLPIAAGPAYVFLALDHGPQFIADAAITSLAVNGATVIYAVVYAHLAQRHGLALSVGLAFMAWLVLTLLCRAVDWTLLGATMINVVILPVCFLAARPLRLAPIPRVRTRWYDVVVRAGLVALLVAVVVGLSFRIGAAGTGILAAFPIVLTSIMLLLHRRVGGPGTAAVLANTVIGLCGFALALLTLNIAALSLGSPLALLLALTVAVAWNLAVFVARRRGVPV